jgi:hypothetical protein
MLGKSGVPGRQNSQTGMMPRVDIETEGEHEPPEPAALPGFDDAGSITGKIRISTEGEDEAKNDDDSATLSA